MTVSEGAELERHERDSLAAVIEQHRAEIEQRWLERVQTDIDLGGRDVSPSDLRNALPEFLAHVAESLRGEAAQTGIAASGSAAWIEVAREHAVTRVRLGFDIGQLVHEFILLRQIVSAVARDHGLVMSSRQHQRMADLIEGAIAAGVQSYVRSRDYEARRKQAEHIGFVTHELRNPLTAAHLAASQLRRHVSSPRAAGTLDQLERGLGRLRELVDSVLETERFEARHIESRPTETSLGPILEEAASVARVQAAQKGLRFQIDGETALGVFADKGLAISAIQNIIDNAVKFTDDGDVRVVVEDQHGEAVIHVYDSCAGLSVEELGTIFEPFHRGHTDKPGTGLGLAIARRAVEAQGGSIHAESTEGSGCHFWLTLPKARH